MLDVRGHFPVRGNARERQLPAFEIAEQRIAEHRVAAAGIARRDASPLFAGSSKGDELLWLLNREPFQQSLSEHRENGGIRTDADCKRQHSRKTQDGCPAERADGRTAVER